MTLIWKRSATPTINQAIVTRDTLLGGSRIRTTWCVSHMFLFAELEALLVLLCAYLRTLTGKRASTHDAYAGTLSEGTHGLDIDLFEMSGLTAETMRKADDSHKGYNARAHRRAAHSKICQSGGHRPSHSLDERKTLTV
jgi:hypothetical protein